MTRQGVLLVADISGAAVAARCVMALVILPPLIATTASVRWRLSSLAWAVGLAQPRANAVATDLR